MMKLFMMEQDVTQVAESFVNHLVALSAVWDAHLPQRKNSSSKLRGGVG